MLVNSFLKVFLFTISFLVSLFKSCELIENNILLLMVNSPGGYWSGSTRTNPSMSVGSLVVVASSSPTTPGHLRGPRLVVSCQGEATGSQTLLVTPELVLMTRDV